MRPIAALLTGAAAATLISGVAQAADDGRDALFNAAFSDGIDFPAATPETLSAGPASFGPAGVSTARYLPGQGLERRATSEVASFGREDLDYLDTVRVSTAAYDPIPGAALLRPDAGAATAGPLAYDVTYVRRWPAAVSVSKGRLNFDVTPHLGLGVSSGGGRSAEAGALLRLAKMAGIAGDAAPRWYMFAGYQKRAMGLNLLRSEDPSRPQKLDDGVAREVQAGLGAHRGRFHALVGYTHENLVMRSLASAPRNDDRVGLSLAFR